MTTETTAAETVDTAATTTDQQPAGAQVAPKGGDGKVDLERLINEEGYAEKVLEEKSTAQPSDAQPVAEQPGEFQPVSQQQEAATGAKPAASEQTVILRDENGNEERIPLTQAQNRLNQARHLQRLYQTEIAPLAKIVRDTPQLQAALRSAIAGDRTSLDRMIAQAQAQQQTDSAKSGEDKIDRLAEQLAKDKKFEGWQKDELKANLSAIAAMQEALKAEAAPPQGDQARLEESFQIESQAIASESARLRTMLEIANPQEHQEVVQTIGTLLKGLYGQVQAGKVREEDFLYTVSLYNDPRNLDESGKPMYLQLYRAAQEYNRQQKAGRPAGAGSPVRGGVNARIAPGAARTGGTHSGSLPSLDGKSREERIALMDSFLGV